MHPCLIALSLLCLFTVGCRRSRKKAYTSETYYEQSCKRNWYTLGITKTQKYKEVIVAVPIDDKVDPAFLITRVLFEKNGGKYKEKKVRTVNIEVYEAADARHQKLLSNLFNSFRILALVGTGAMVIGLFLFVLKFQFPTLPSIWDEFLLYGGIATCIGMLGAWYVEEFIIVSMCGGAALVAASGYSLIRHYRETRKHHETVIELGARDIAVADIVETVEVLKIELGDRWEEVSKKLRQNPDTKRLVDSLQVEARMRAERAHAS